MNHHVPLGCICSLLLISLAGICMAEESPGFAVYIQGGESSITNGTDGMGVITVTDIVPYIYIADGKKSILIPVELLSLQTDPLNAAVVFSGADGESVSLVEVSNLLLSDGNTSLTLQVKPLEFYEGSVLKSFASEKKKLDIGSVGRFKGIGIYLEIIGPALKNNNCLAQTIACLKADDMKACLGECG